MSVQATDADLNRTILYSLEGSDETLRLLEMDAETGDISARQRIDRERVNWLNMTVRATDSGFPPRSSFAHVFVSVVDENDNAPAFSSDLYEVAVSEAVGPHTDLVQVVATDPDLGSNGEVSYSFGERSRRLARLFSVDPHTGWVSTQGALDFERRRQYDLEVVAADNGGNGGLKSTAKVICKLPTDSMNSTHIISGKP